MVAMVSVLFIHGVGGPQPGWDTAVRDGVAAAWPDRPDAAAGTSEPLPSISTVTLRYDDIFDTEPTPPAHVPPEVDRSGLAEDRRAEFTARREQLVARVAAAATDAGGTDGSKRLRPPKLVPSAAVVRMPLPGMSHAMAYRRDLQVRDIVRARVASRLFAAAEPRIVIAHSLGSVVALDALHVHDVPVDLLVTIGSPLGIDRGWARPWEGGVAFPHARLGSWLNVVNTRDPIPWSRGVQERFPEAVDAFISAGSRPVGPGGAHDPVTYISSGVVISVLVDALAAAAAGPPRQSHPVARTPFD